MKRRRLVTTVAVVIVIAAAGFRLMTRRGAAGPLRAGSAELAIEWRGKYRGRMVLPAKINWCPVTRVAVLEAVSGDSGVAIVLYEREALTGGPHPVLSPDMAASAPRPVATAALRWIRVDTDTALAGFRALSGAVRIQLAPGKLSGDIDARMLGVTKPDTLVVRGVFRDVPVISSAVGCS